ncbi:MAG: FAD:protein FMN transferase [Candidatus Omnitrophota bacterium]
MRKTKLNLIITIFISLFVSGCSQENFLTRTKFFMGTIVEVTVPNQEAAKIVFDEFKALEEKLSHFNPNSEIAKLNTQGEIAADPQLVRLIKKSLEVSKASSGAFDVSCAPLVDIWKKAIQEKKEPNKLDIKKALSLVGWQNIYLDKQSGIIKLKKGMKIDLGAIAKGFAVDEAITKLKEAGVKSALINAGGNSYCLGTKAGRPWNIGLINPRKTNEIIKTFSLSDKAIATSGDYEQFFISNNKRYSHIINPHSGYPVENGICSVTVVAQDATTADALSTAIFVLGEEKGMKLAKEFKATDVKIIKGADCN